MQEHGEYLSFFVAVCDESEYPYRSDHGLSILISTSPGPPNLLFDTGSHPRPLQKNLLMHGVSLDTIAVVAISHGHYDHTGGLSAFHTVEEPPIVYANPGIRRERYMVYGEGARYIGIPQDLKTLSGLPFQKVTGCREIWPGIWALNPIDRSNEFERSDEPLCLDRNGVIPDTFKDEMALVAESPLGLVLFSGCSHRGIVNAVDTVHARFEGRDVHAVVGGFHLRRSSEERHQQTARALAKRGVKKVFAGHCTGEKAQKALHKEYGSDFVPLFAGLTQVFSERSQ